MGTIVTNTYKGFSDHSDIVTQEVSSNVTENSSEIGRENADRDASGKFLPGYAGGPGRLPFAIVSDAIKADLRAGKAVQVKDKLFTLMDSARRESVQLAAIQEIMDRSEGKAVQNHRHAGIFMVLAPGEEVLNAAFGSVAPEDE